MDLEKKSITAENGSSASYCPRRGGMVTSVIFEGEEILYLNETTFKDPHANIRGGIPILFPNAGPVESPDFPLLKRHGFARNSSNWKDEIITPDRFKEILQSDEETKKVYPFDFRLTLEGLIESKSFIHSQTIENLSPDKALPVSTGFHPYFKVPDEAKGDVKISIGDTPLSHEQTEKWMSGEFISLNNEEDKIKVFLPELGEIIVETSPEYKRFWIWSLPGENFVCIEPVMRDVGGLLCDPVVINPNQSLNTWFKISKC